MWGKHGHLFQLDKTQEEDRPGAKLELLKLFKYLKPYRLQVTFALLVSVIVTGISLIPPRLIGIIIDEVIVKKAISKLYFMSFALLITYVVSNALDGLKTFLMGKLGQNVTYDLWQSVYISLQRLSFNFYDTNQTGNIMSRVTNDVNAVERVIVDGVDVVLIASLTLVGVSVILFRMNRELALITMVPIPVLVILAWSLNQRAHKIFRNVRRKMGEISALLQDSISGIREIKSFGREDYEANRLSEKSTDYLTTNLQAIKLRAVLFPAIITTTSIGTIFVLLFGGRIAITTNQLSAGEIVSFLFYLGLFYRPIHELNRVNHMLQHARASSERIFEVIDAVPQIRELPDAVTIPRPVKGEVVFSNVHFSYDDGEEILHGIDFKTNQGEAVALVGPTGSGKTTIANLIPRFYDVNEGNILIDNIDIQKLKLRDLRKNIGIVMQEPFLFNGSIAENIAYGRLESTMDEIIHVAKLANIHSFITSLEDRYDHQIGERGIKLSVGEKQRIAIARTLLKDPPILILDEATSSVDTRTEALIQEAIEHLLLNRTSFVIAHRLSTIIHADKILVVHNGKIVEAGTHKELLARNGLYYKLYETQWHSKKSTNREV